MTKHKIERNHNKHTQSRLRMNQADVVYYFLGSNDNNNNSFCYSTEVYAKQYENNIKQYQVMDQNNKYVHIN